MGCNPRSGATPLFTMKAVSLASSQGCSRVDADARCKLTLISEAHTRHLICGIFRIWAPVDNGMCLKVMCVRLRSILSSRNGSVARTLQTQGKRERPAQLL